MLPFVSFSGIVLFVYRRIGSRYLKLSTKALVGLKVFPIRDHFYEPLFNDRHLSKSLRNDRKLPKVNINESGQLSFLKNLTFKNELDFMSSTRSIENKKEEKEQFRFENGFFESGDAEFLYQFIRYIKPTRIVEIGSGYSTLIASEANAKNLSESGLRTDHICIEPYRNEWLEQNQTVTLIRQKVEDLDVDWSTYLKEGDLLFIDSSHVIRPQGDVLHEFQTIIPSLRRGVHVHIHDIFTPRDYLDSWIKQDKRFWNEQYLLEVLLQNPRYEITAALNYLKHNYFGLLSKVCPFLTTDREPVSLYFKVVLD
jgi:predicted O-methyltransferase YrrM